MGIRSRWRASKAQPDMMALSSGEAKANGDFTQRRRGSKGMQTSPCLAYIAALRETFLHLIFALDLGAWCRFSNAEVAYEDEYSHADLCGSCRAVLRAADGSAKAI
jgi:hypothetical protein